MRTVAKAVLVLSNVGFIVTGFVLVWLGMESRDPEWSTIFSRATATNVNMMATGLAVLGVGAVLVAVFGFAGAAWHSRTLLTLYSVFVALGLLAFLAIAILGVLSAVQANTWTTTAFPADAGEKNVADGFNRVYCYAEGGRLCASTSIADAIEAVFPPSAGGGGAAPFKAAGIDVHAKTGLLGLCDQIAGAEQSIVQSLPAHFNKACAACENATLDKYTTFVGWVDAHCPLTSATARWCGELFVGDSQAATAVYATNSPYRHCRDSVSSLWKECSVKASVGGASLAVFSLVVIVVLFTTVQEADHPGYTSI